LLVTGALVGAVDAAIYWGVGWLIDLLSSVDPAELLANHGVALAGLIFLLAAGRPLAMIASALVEQQIIVPAFFSRVRWQAFRRVIEQPYAFYQNDFAGRIATKIMQGGEAVGDFIVNSLQSLWSFLTFVVLTGVVLSTLDPWLAAVVALWLAAYLAIIRFLMPGMRRAGARLADQRSVTNGRLVDAFTNIVAVKLFDQGGREHDFVRDGF